jgi:hypothetical protein
MCLLLVFGLQGAFLPQPLTLLTRQTRQAALAINQSIFYMISMSGALTKYFNQETHIERIGSVQMT